MSWTLLDPKPHVPQVLSKEGLEEIRLIGLYPNAADLLATLDAALDESERLRKECGEERAAYLNASHERDSLRAYAELLADALGELQHMLAKQLMGLADGVQCAACGVRADTETHADNCPVKNGLAIIEDALAKEPGELRHQSGREPFLLDCLAGKLTTIDAVAGYVSTLELEVEKLRHQVCNDDVLSQAVRDFITVFEGRHYGRMPDEVATALENMKCLVACTKQEGE